MLFRAGVNVVGSVLPTPTDVLGGPGTQMFLRGLVYWAMAIVLIVATRGRLGCDSKETGRAATSP